MNKKVLLIDNNPIFSNGVKRLLEKQGMDVMTATGIHETGIQLVEQLNPHILIIDIKIAQTNNFQLLTQLREQHPNCKVALLARQTNSNQLKRILQDGVHGYLARNIEPDLLLEAIRDMEIGKTVVPMELSSILARFQKTQGGNPGKSELPELIATLTPREYETLVLLTEGMNNKIIARHMELTEGTVKNHVKAILSKLNVDTRINAAVIALEYGIGTESE